MSQLHNHSCHKHLYKYNVTTHVQHKYTKTMRLKPKRSTLPTPGENTYTTSYSPLNNHNRHKHLYKHNDTTPYKHKYTNTIQPYPLWHTQPHCLAVPRQSSRHTCTTKKALRMKKKHLALNSTSQLCASFLTQPCVSPRKKTPYQSPVRLV